MTTTRKFEKARFASEMAESLGDVVALGLIEESERKRTLRDLDASQHDAIILPMSGPEIRALRERAHVSQALLAKYLNLSRDHLSKLERGATPATGALLAMLNVIRRKGIDSIL